MAKKKRTAAQKRATRKMLAARWGTKRRKGKRKGKRRKSGKRRSKAQRAATNKMLAARWSKLGIAPWGKAFSKSRGFAAVPPKALNAAINKAIRAAHKKAKSEGRFISPDEIDKLTSRMRRDLASPATIELATAGAVGAVAALEQQKAGSGRMTQAMYGLRTYRRGLRGLSKFEPGQQTFRAPWGMKGIKPSPVAVKDYGTRRRRSRRKTGTSNPWNPQYFPQRGPQRGRLAWWIIDVFGSIASTKPTTYVDITTKSEAERAAERLLCQHHAATVELSGPYRSQPHAATPRK